MLQHRDLVVRHADLPESIGRRLQLILRQEEAFARALAGVVLPKPEISVWMVLLPILLLYHAHRVQQHRAGLRAFVEGILRNKKRALDAARQEVATGREADRDPAVPAPARTDLSPAALALEEAQAAEADLLKAHYRRLLAGQGATYEELVRKGYGTGGEYRAFLRRLARAEAAVYRAVLECRRQPEGEEAVVRNMEQAARDLREEASERIFDAP